MPGWHEATKDLVADGKLHLLGITQEQHAERCRLFAQWKQFKWPILHDPINLLGCKAVPIVIAIDEHGIVRSTKPTHAWVRNEFVTTKYSTESVGKSQPLAQSKGDEAMLWNSDPNRAVKEYSLAIAKHVSSMTHFRLGVALRARHDSSQRQSTDFMKAVSHWTSALEMDPNQYIWRRRIQQYGPRLQKPYPFYDWVDKAQNEIKKRGDVPVQLRVPLSGAEIAKPSKAFSVTKQKQTSPDPKNQITRDNGELATFSFAASPAAIKSGENCRLHLELSPAVKSARWNNEAEPLRIWIEPNESMQPEQQLLTHDGDPGQAESREHRKLEVELRATGNPGIARLRGFALYNVCEKVGGQCVMRRQDFSVNITIR